MLLAVPSYRRATNGQAQTFSEWPADGPPLTVFVRSEEHDAYVALLTRLGRSHWHVVPIPEDSGVCNISTTRNWILEYAMATRHSAVVMVDDDLHFISRSIPDDDVHLRPCGVEEIRGLVQWFQDHIGTTGAERPRYAHAAVSMREGNNRVPGKGAQEETTRGIRMVGYNLDALRTTKIRFRPEVDGREDLDMTLQLLRAGYPNVVTYHWAQGQKVANAPGGLSEYRDVAHSDASARKLAELHPDFVRLRDKKNTSGGEFGVRVETTIYWKKALQSAGNNHHTTGAR
jgi:hypothetical protein